MRPRFKALLLSALVFPGVGQLYNQERRKGVVLVLGANLLLGVLLLAALAVLSQEYYAVFYPAPLTMDLFRQLLADLLRHPLFLCPLLLLLALWGFAAVDAARSAVALPKEE